MAADEQAQKVEEFNAKVEEVFGDLGVAIAAVVTDAHATPGPRGETPVRAAWQTLGRSFAELMDTEPPR